MAKDAGLEGSLRIGIIGFGVMGRLHFRLLTELASSLPISVVGVSDVIDVSASLAPPTTYCKDVEALLAIGIDAALITTPTSLHLDIARRLVDANIPLLIEKPAFASSLEFEAFKELLDKKGRYLAGYMETLDILGRGDGGDAYLGVCDGKGVERKMDSTLCNEKGVERKMNKACPPHLRAQAPIYVGHIERFNAPLALTRLVDNDIRAMYLTRTSPYPVRISDVGVDIDLSVHDIDLARYISGKEITSSYKCASPRERPSSASFILRLGEKEDALDASPAPFANVISTWDIGEKRREVEIVYMPHKAPNKEGKAAHKDASFINSLLKDGGCLRLDLLRHEAFVIANDISIQIELEETNALEDEQRAFIMAAFCYYEGLFATQGMGKEGSREKGVGKECVSDRGVSWVDLASKDAIATLATLQDSLESIKVVEGEG